MTDLDTDIINKGIFNQVLAPTTFCHPLQQTAPYAIPRLLREEFYSELSQQVTGSQCSRGKEGLAESWSGLG